MMTRVLLHDFKQFKGRQELILSKRSTLVLGGCGSGKTNLFKGIQEGVITRSPCVGVKHTLRDVERFGSLIFIGEEDLLDSDFQTRYSSLFGERNVKQKQSAYEKYTSFFTGIDSMKNSFSNNNNEMNGCWWEHRYDVSRENIQVSQLSMGQKIMVNFLFLVSLRRSIGCDVPLILDNPFSRLPYEYRTSMLRVLEQMPCQVLVFASDLSDAEIAIFRRVYHLDIDHKTEKTTITPKPLITLKKKVSGVNLSLIVYEFR